MPGFFTSLVPCLDILSRAEQSWHEVQPGPGHHFLTAHGPSTMARLPPPSPMLSLGGSLLSPASNLWQLVAGQQQTTLICVTSEAKVCVLRVCNCMHMSHHSFTIIPLERGPKCDWRITREVRLRVTACSGPVQGLGAPTAMVSRCSEASLPWSCSWQSKGVTNCPVCTGVSHGCLFSHPHEVRLSGGGDPN